VLCNLDVVRVEAARDVVGERFFYIFDPERRILDREPFAAKAGHDECVRTMVEWLPKYERERDTRCAVVFCVWKEEGIPGNWTVSVSPVIIALTGASGLFAALRGEVSAVHPCFAPTAAWWGFWRGCSGRSNGPSHAVVNLLNTRTPKNEEQEIRCDQQFDVVLEGMQVLVARYLEEVGGEKVIKCGSRSVGEVSEAQHQARYFKECVSNIKLGPRRRQFFPCIDAFQHYEYPLVDAGPKANFGGVVYVNGVPRAFALGIVTGNPAKTKAMAERRQKRHWLDNSGTAWWLQIHDDEVVFYVNCLYLHSDNRNHVFADQIFRVLVGEVRKAVGRNHRPVHLVLEAPLPKAEKFWKSVGLTPMTGTNSLERIFPPTFQ
jgi:hypothetical protein